MAVDHEHIVEAVEVHVQERSLPRPVAGCKACEIRNFREGSVASTAEQSIPGNLRPVLENSRSRRRRKSGRPLAQTRGVIGAQHFDDKEVKMTVPVEIGEVHAHRSVALRALREARYE